MEMETGLISAGFSLAATASGGPELNDIKDDTDISTTDCVYCCESIWLLRGFTFGFRIFPADAEGLPPPKINENYELKAEGGM